MFFTNTALWMLSSGEASGSFADSLDNIAVSAEARADHYSRLIQIFIPIAFTVAAGILVGGLIWVLIVPLFTMMGQWPA